MEPHLFPTSEPSPIPFFDKRQYTIANSLSNFELLWTKQHQFVVVLRRSSILSHIVGKSLQNLFHIPHSSAAQVQVQVDWNEATYQG